MSAQIRSLRQQPPSRTPQRQALADAIAAHTEAEQHLAAVKQALESSWPAIGAAERAVREAEAAVERAKIDAAGHLAATMMGTAGAAPMSVKKARSNLLDAQDQLDAATDAKLSLGREERQTESALAIARMTLNDAVRDVIKSDPATQRLLDELAAARTAVAEITAKLASLPADAIPDAYWNFEKPQAVRQTDPRFQATIASLRVDADTPLPSS